MTREKLAELIRWPLVIATIGVLNPFMMVPQLYKLWTTHDANSISLATLGLLVVIQGGFSLHGYFTRDKFVMLSNGAAVAVTIATIASALHFS